MSKTLVIENASCEMTFTVSHEQAVNLAEYLVKNIESDIDPIPVRLFGNGMTIYRSDSGDENPDNGQS